MSVKKKTCPHCGAMFRLNPEQGIGPYGSPQRICPDCKETYYDREYREIAVNGIDPMDKWAVSPAVFKSCAIPMLLGIMILGYMIVNARFDVLQAIFVLMFLGFPSIMIVQDVKRRPARLQYLKEEAARSEERLQDPQYAQMLKDLGYKVPEKYLVEKPIEKQKNA